MTSSNGNIFRVTGPLCGEFTGPSEFPTQRPVTLSFDVFFDLRLNKRLSKQPWGWWFETPSWSLWRQCNDYRCFGIHSLTNMSICKNIFRAHFVKNYKKSEIQQFETFSRLPGLLFKLNTVFLSVWISHYKRIRRSDDRVIFIMGIPIWVCNIFVILITHRIWYFPCRERSFSEISTWPNSSLASEISCVTKSYTVAVCKHIITISYFVRLRDNFISMLKCKTAVSSLVMNQRYRSVAKCNRSEWTDTPAQDCTWGAGKNVMFFTTTSRHGATPTNIYENTSHIYEIDIQNRGRLRKCFHNNWYLYHDQVPWNYTLIIDKRA